jgi:hypothetical protein
VSNIETQDEAQTEAPKKKIVKKKRKARAFPKQRAEEKATPVPAEFAGISTTECCDACNKDGCVISGKFYCAHPMKGGLQSTEMQDNDALRRFNRAKGALRNQMIDLRGR